MPWVFCFRFDSQPGLYSSGSDSSLLVAYMTDPRFQLNIAVKADGVFLLLVSPELVVAHTALNTCSEYAEEVPWLMLQLFDLNEENNLS
jgi:hypothetical protein